MMPSLPPPRTQRQRIVSISLHAALGFGVGYTLSHTLEPHVSIPVSLGLFTGPVIWLIFEMRRLRRDIMNTRAEIDRIYRQASPIAFIDPNEQHHG